MKNKSFYAIIVLVWCISSCKKDFISLTPQTQLSSATYFKTADQFQQALTGVYQALRGWAEPSSWLMGETRSDNTRYDYNPLIATVAGLERQSVADWTDDAYNSTTKTKYTSDYTGIERANIILDQIANAKIDSTIKNTITGESEVLRAFFYFDLVQFYGGVPLNVHTVSNPSQAFLPRSPVEDVYAQIITDLKDAITKLPQKVTFSQTGHVTIGTAETLLANVY
ncbi:MAG TPA: RagB/SusD family nutrient uptake outer membrane protein, partial [Hanamia sp.]